MTNPATHHVNVRQLEEELCSASCDTTTLLMLMSDFGKLPLADRARIVNRWAEPDDRGNTVFHHSLSYEDTDALQLRLTYLDQLPREQRHPIVQSWKKGNHDGNTVFHRAGAGPEALKLLLPYLDQLSIEQRIPIIQSWATSNSTGDNVFHGAAYDEKSLKLLLPYLNQLSPEQRTPLIQSWATPGLHHSTVFHLAEIKELQLLVPYLDQLSVEQRLPIIQSWALSDREGRTIFDNADADELTLLVETCQAWLLERCLEIIADSTLPAGEKDSAKMQALAEMTTVLGPQHATRLSNISKQAIQAMFERAITSGNVCRAKVLLQAHAKQPFLTTQPNQKTPEQRLYNKAIKTGQIPVALWTLENFPAIDKNPVINPQTGARMLDWASANQQLEQQKFLLSKGINPFVATPDPRHGANPESVATAHDEAQKLDCSDHKIGALALGPNDPKPTRCCPYEIAMRRGDASALSEMAIHPQNYNSFFLAKAGLKTNQEQTIHLKLWGNSCAQPAPVAAAVHGQNNQDHKRHTDELAAPSNKKARTEQTPGPHL